MSDKVSVKVFLPVGVCSCSVTGFLAGIYEAVKKYKDVVDYSEDIATCKMAKEIGVIRQGVLVGSKYFEGNVTTANLEHAILEELSNEN